MRVFREPLCIHPRPVRVCWSPLIVIAVLRRPSTNPTLLVIGDTPLLHDATNLLCNLGVSLCVQVKEHRAPGLAGKLPRTLAVANGTVAAVVLDHSEEGIVWALIKLDTDPLIEALGDVRENVHV